jgi:hypothetical protein
MEQLGKYFRIFGVLFLVMIIVFVVGILAAIIVPLVADSALMETMKSLLRGMEITIVPLCKIVHSHSNLFQGGFCGEKCFGA